MKVSQFRECKDLELNFFECPSSLFLLAGLITVLLVISAFFIARNYYSEEIVFLITVFITSVMLVIAYFAHNGTTKVALAKKRLQESNYKLKVALQKLKEAEEMQQDFMHMMVHDLRSPLNGIRMISDMLLSDLKKERNEKLAEPIGLINNSAFYMLSIVNDLLDLAKIEAGMFRVEKKLADPILFLKDVIKYFQPMAKARKIKLRLKTEQDLPKVAFDEKALRQVFENLISNSIKFTREKDFIEIQVFKHKRRNNLDEEARDFGINWHLKGGDPKLDNYDSSLVMAVTDNGEGISLEGLSKLFNKFEQMKTPSKTREKGTGLGLVIVKGIIEAHGGTIGVASKEGVGTTFYFNLLLK